MVKRVSKLYEPVNLSLLGELKNHAALAPLTRGRSNLKGTIEPQHVDYYTQRSADNGGVGLVISEGTFPHPTGIGFVNAPGIFNDEQRDSWKPVAQAVKNAGSKFFIQLWHTGRASHSAYQVNGALPLAPSPIRLIGDGTFKMRVPGNPDPVMADIPKEMTQEDIDMIADAFASSAKRAVDAGADGVEVHAANGYIIDTFLQSVSNKRTDKYGGSLENRMRFLKDVLSKTVNEVGNEKVGVRFSPNGGFNDMGSEDNIETFERAIEIAAEFKVAYVHILDGLAFGFHKKCEPFDLDRAMKVIKKVQGDKRVTALIANAGYDREQGEKTIDSGKADLIAYGRPLITNPDLLKRYQYDLELASFDQGSYYYVKDQENPSKGYSDFPPAKI